MVSVEIFVLVLILEELLSDFTIEYNVTGGLVMYGLCFVEVCVFYTHFVENL